MKYLKIENNKGLYWDGNEHKEIDKIDKDGLLVLLNAAEKDDFQLDSYNEKLLENKAQQVIYENIYLKLEQFLKDKDQFKTEVDKLYKEAIGKYSADVKKEGYDEIDDSESDQDDEEICIEDVPF
jgi:hypothetical protein